VTDDTLQNVDANGNVDCTDDSTGAGIAGTANTWTGNVAADSDPAGICTPVS
jgi:hypothetical protein